MGGRDILARRVVPISRKPFRANSSLPVVSLLVAIRIGFVTLVGSMAVGARRRVPGLFGMNIGGIPFREHDGGFWIVVLLLVVFVSLGGALVFRARRNS
jgi:Mg2+ and Co2+ transporter CorA